MWVRLVVLVVVAVLSALVPLDGHATSTIETEGLPLVLGVTIGSPGELDLVDEIADGKPFSVRVPLDLSEDPAVAATRLAAIREAADRGYRVTVNLRNHAATGSVADPVVFADWVSRRASDVSQDGAAAIEIGNRPNAFVPDPDSDAQPLALESVVLGVLAAAEAAPDADIGFSWLATAVEAHDIGWWSRLRVGGGDALASAVDFVSAQLHPGTWTPASYGGTKGPEETARHELVRLRTDLMPEALLGKDVDIVVGEFSHPVAERPLPVAAGSVVDNWALRTEANQARVLDELVDGIGWVAEGLRVREAMWAELTDPAGCRPTGCIGLVDASGARRNAFHELRYHQRRTSS